MFYLGRLPRYVNAHPSMFGRTFSRLLLFILSVRENNAICDRLTSVHAAIAPFTEIWWYCSFHQTLLILKKQKYIDFIIKSCRCIQSLKNLNLFQVNTPSQWSTWIFNRVYEPMGAHTATTPPTNPHPCSSPERCCCRTLQRYHRQQRASMILRSFPWIQVATCHFDRESETTLRSI